MRREFTVCRGCHSNILLDDNMGTVKNAVRAFDQSLEKLLKVFS